MKRKPYRFYHYPYDGLKPLTHRELVHINTFVQKWGTTARWVNLAGEYT